MPLLERHKDSDGWVSDIYTRDTPAEDFGLLASFKHIWDSKCDGLSLPAWGDFELANDGLNVSSYLNAAALLPD